MTLLELKPAYLLFDRYGEVISVFSTERGAIEMAEYLINPTIKKISFYEEQPGGNWFGLLESGSNG